jgi:hypothetical protein
VNIYTYIQSVLVEDELSAEDQEMDLQEEEGFQMQLHEAMTHSIADLD